MLPEQIINFITWSYFEGSFKYCPYKRKIKSSSKSCEPLNKWYVFDLARDKEGKKKRKENKILKNGGKFKQRQ